MRRLAAVLSALAVLASACSLVGGGGDSYLVSVYFDRTISLFETSQVRVLGLPAGRVRTIEVEEDRVRVDVAVDADIPLPADVHATIVPLSLIGERFVQFFPAWTEGQPRLADGDIVPLERTVVPVEPDEALESVKNLLDDLDADATGRLVSNLAEALDGQGPAVNSAIESLSGLTSTLADRTDTLETLIDNFDEFTSTLVTRESQLGEILDAFATATQVLADERESIQDLVEGLGTLSGDLFDLVSEHGDSLEHDLQILGRTLRGLDANLAGVEDLLDSGPPLVAGLLGAADPVDHVQRLRNSYSPTVGQQLDPFSDTIGGSFGDELCLPIDTVCSASVGGGIPVTAQSLDAARPVTVGGTPLDALFDLLATGTTRPAPVELAAPTPAPAREGTLFELWGVR